MGRALLAALAVAFAGATAGLAQDAPSRTGTPEQAAEKVLAAVAAKDDAALKALAAKDDPDPWLVADELCARGACDGAGAFAKTAAARKDAEALPAWVAARRARPSDDAARKAFGAALRGLRAGRPLAALETLEVAKCEGDDVLSVRVARVRGEALCSLSRFEESAAVLLDAAGTAKRLGWARGEASALDASAFAAHRYGDQAAAIDRWTQVLAIEEARGAAKGPDAARALGNLGLVHEDIGDYARALTFHDRALKLMVDLADRRGEATALGNIGTTLMHVGACDEAFGYQTRALALSEELKYRSGVARANQNIGLIHFTRRDLAPALAALQKALPLQIAEGDLDEAATTIGFIGLVQGRSGRLDEALATFQRAQFLAMQAGDRTAVAGAQIAVGMARFDLGDPGGSEKALLPALDATERLGVRHLEAIASTALARARQALGRPRDAIADARRAVAAAGSAVSGLAYEQGAAARSGYAAAYAVGVSAALDAGDASEALFFLESGRAGSLVESLGARAALQAATLPAELFEAESRARLRASAAQAAYQGAAAGGDAQAVRAAKEDLERAQAEFAGVVARIQREQKTAASVVCPRAASLDEVRALVRDGEALVLYALFVDDLWVTLPRFVACAVVVTPRDARIVPLGKTADIESACAALSADDTAGDPGPAAECLRKLVLDPLALGPEVRRLLVSPDGSLAYVPFTLLAGGREVALVPSGTVYGLLQDEAGKRGKDVLALGDPDYRSASGSRAAGLYAGGRKLRPLPSTRGEARTVGTKLLLGTDATEQGLRAAIASSSRWRAVHLACHGLVDPERPMFSALALTPAGEDDGFLTALEVFGMKVPADLVVLSACETGKGKVYRAEGIVGLTRAFMFAGAPRVLVSLWKVDDEATAALMAKFYEGWKKGVPAARALREAQAHVRSQEKWKHPAYWAAWVLWGLPE